MPNPMAEGSWCFCQSPVRAQIWRLPPAVVEAPSRVMSATLLLPQPDALTATLVLLKEHHASLLQGLADGREVARSRLSDASLEVSDGIPRNNGPARQSGVVDVK